MQLPLFCQLCGFSVDHTARPHAVPALVVQARLGCELKDLRNAERGKHIHDAAVNSGHCSSVSVANTLISMYAKCGNLAEARSVFEHMPARSVVSWNALILGYAEKGDAAAAFNLFQDMTAEGYSPNARTFLAVVKACTRACSVERGRAVHLLALIAGCCSNIYVGSALVDMYSKCCCLEDARMVFERMANRNAVSWNALIYGYAENGQEERALLLFARMGFHSCPPTARTFVAVINACALLKCTDRGKQAHLLASDCGCDSDVYVQSALVDMYAKCGCLIEAHRMYETVPHWSLVPWAALMFGYAENGESNVVLEMFSEMVRERRVPNSWAIVAALKACTDLARKTGTEIEAQERVEVLQLVASITGCDSDIYVQNTLVDFYAKCGRLEEAQHVFDRMLHPDVVSWNALVSGYAENGEAEKALVLISTMGLRGWTPDAATFVAAIRAITDVAVKERMDLGRVIHLLASKSGCDSVFHVQSALVILYSKCGSTQEARQVFDRMRNPDMSSWNALMLGYAENGQAGSVLELYVRLEREDREADADTFAAVFKACGLLGALASGRAVHREIRDRCLEDDLVTSLVDFYVKCGSMSEALSVFNAHLMTNSLRTWNALMESYCSIGDTRGVFDLFKRMQDRNLKPDASTLSILLAACNHAALPDEGTKVFELVSTKYGVTPSLEHYRSMLDMLCNTSELEKAMRLSRSMRFNPGDLIWSKILEASRRWSNAGLVKLATENLGH